MLNKGTITIFQWLHIQSWFESFFLSVPYISSLVCESFGIHTMFVSFFSHFFHPEITKKTYPKKSTTHRMKDEKKWIQKCFFWFFCCQFNAFDR